MNFSFISYIIFNLHFKNSFKFNFYGPNIIFVQIKLNSQNYLFPQSEIFNI
jgi:hypothetical protein